MIILQLKTTRESGIPLSESFVKGKSPTISFAASGVSRHPSADMLLRESELDQNLISKTGIFHYGSISLIAEPWRSAHLSAMDIAKMSGSILSYDPNLRLALWPSPEAAREGVMSIWDKADIIKVQVSDEEISFLIGGNGQSFDENIMLKKLFPNFLKLPFSFAPYKLTHLD